MTSATLVEDIKKALESSGADEDKATIAARTIASSIGSGDADFHMLRKDIERLESKINSTQWFVGGGFSIVIGMLGVVIGKV